MDDRDGWIRMAASRIEDPDRRIRIRRMPDERFVEIDTIATK
jgi:hypothetical protein